MTGQASLDVMALNNSQNQLRQTVQAGRQEMIDKLAVIAQDQQGWISRFDAAQAKVATMADSITALERQITNLQGVLQTSIEDTTAVVGVTGQQRLQFETRVSQDVQAMMDSLTQLRQVQSLLQEQMMQVQKSTQGQAESIRSALEQMKQPPAELKVSDAKEKSLPAVIVESAE
ncbi:MAG: hypothetical protein A2Y77_11215 [Planctomycetes bacterium RBG_13_62_9]|nr:MAG: hypothetical protein A2Y77_11215 [Planctomycetes bacterium RBG_13_62_9]